MRTYLTDKHKQTDTETNMSLAITQILQIRLKTVLMIFDSDYQPA